MPFAHPKAGQPGSPSKNLVGRLGQPMDYDNPVTHAHSFCKLPRQGCVLNGPSTAVLTHGRQEPKKRRPLKLSVYAGSGIPQLGAPAPRCSQLPLCNSFCPMVCGEMGFCPHEAPRICLPRLSVIWAFSKPAASPDHRKAVGGGMALWFLETSFRVPASQEYCFPPQGKLEADL